MKTLSSYRAHQLFRHPNLQIHPVSGPRKPRNWHRPLALGALLVLAGCVPVALDPFYKAADVTQEAHLLGVWNDPKDTATHWTFEAGKDKAYRLTIATDDGTSPFVAHLFQLKDQRFLDLFPDSSALKEMKLEGGYKIALVPSHLLFRVNETQPLLKLQVLKLEWLEELLKANPAALEHRYTGEDDDSKRLVFLARTDVLQAFLLKHQGNTNAWQDLDVLEKASGAR